MGLLFNLAVLVSATFNTAVLAAPTVNYTNIQARGGCASDNGGAYIIAARGSTEAPGMGALGALAGMVQAQIPGTEAVGLDYPALLSPYQWSVDQGTQALTQAIENYVAACPKARIVLMGYSQGAQVVMNSLCGTSESSFTPTSQLPKHLWHHIAAVLNYADLTHLVHKKYDAGTATLDGVFPRQHPQGCRPFARRIRSYCDADDRWCASGSSQEVHEAYFGKYNNEAAQWLVHKTKHHLPWRRHHH